MVENPALAADMGFDLWVRKILWRRVWQYCRATVFLPGESREQGSPAGNSPWGRKRVGHD